MHQLILILCEYTNSHGTHVFKGDMDQYVELCNGSRGLASNSDHDFELFLLPR